MTILEHKIATLIKRALITDRKAKASKAEKANAIFLTIICIANHLIKLPL